MNQEPKQIKLDLLRKAERPEMVDVWVMNKTGRGGRQAGNLALSIIVNGIHQSLLVPVTWIPLNLSEEIGSEHLLKDPVFRRELTMGRLTLHDAAECEAFMQDPSAIAEYNRIQEFRSGVENTVNTDGEVYSDNAVQSSDPLMEIASNRIQSDEIAAEAGAPGSKGVLTLVVQTLLDDDTSEVQKMNTLRTNAAMLEEIDLSYIIKKSSSNNIQNWARQVLGQMRKKKERA